MNAENKSDRTIAARLVLPFLAVSIAFVWHADARADSEANIVPGWGKVVIDSTPLMGSWRAQVADIAYGGDRRFAVIYIASLEQRSGAVATPNVSGVLDPRMSKKAALLLPPVPTDPDPNEERGALRLAHFDIDRQMKSLPVSLGTSASWVRAATGGPIEQSGCPLELQLAAFAPNTTPVLENPEHISFFAYASIEDGDDEFERRVNLARVRWCGSRFSVTQHRVRLGKKPSVAIGRHNGETKLLVVYGRENKLFGQFLDITATHLGREFVIATFDSDEVAQSTDVIWNSVSQRFIVGFIRLRAVGYDSTSPDLCSIRNVRINWQGGAATPVLQGLCDPQRKGHHTSVDIDERQEVNPEGTYAWWYQGDQGGKALRIMGPSGQPTGKVADIVQNGWTIPVSARRDAVVPFDQFSFFSGPSGSYVVAGRASPFTGGEQRLTGWTLRADGSLPRFGILESTFHRSLPVAIESLQDESVSLWRCCTSNVTTDDYEFWAITVFSHTRKPDVVFDPGISGK